MRWRQDCHGTRGRRGDSEELRDYRRMLRLSKKADYALMAMKHLALLGDQGSSSAREIAGQYDIPIELMAKVLQRSGPTGFADVPSGHARRVSAGAGAARDIGG